MTSNSYGDICRITDLIRVCVGRLKSSRKLMNEFIQIVIINAAKHLGMSKRESLLLVLTLTYVDLNAETRLRKFDWGWGVGGETFRDETYGVKISIQFLISRNLDDLVLISFTPSILPSEKYVF